MDSKNIVPPTVAFHTLGCKVNQHDSDIMAALFQDAGYEVVSFSDPADVYVVNTCTVTHLSDRKSRQMLRRAIGQNPAAIVVACGCYAQTSPEAIMQIEGVDILIGTNERMRIVETVDAFRISHEPQIYLPSDDELFYFEHMPHKRLSSMTRAYIKIQEGCNQFCSYCVIPFARGPLRSRSVADTVEEVSLLVENGYKEVILTGIHIGVYGRGMKDEDASLVDLCRAILNETAICRIRLGSIECTEISDELIELMKENQRMARHLHIPLQAGCDSTLRRMRRPYNCEKFRQVVGEVRRNMPGLAVTTDVMVGFPGETEDDFRESMIFCNDLAFSDMHIFKYSMREGTPAAAMTDQIKAEEKDRRAKLMAEVALKNRLAYQKQYLGKTMEVLLEEEGEDRRFYGHTSNYLRVKVGGLAKSGELHPVILNNMNKGVLEGELISPNC